MPVVGKIIPLEKQCEFCHKNESTRLCDYINEMFYGRESMGGLQYTQCSAKVCDECTTKIMYNKQDICPNCREILKKQLLKEEV